MCIFVVLFGLGLGECWYYFCCEEVEVFLVDFGGEFIDQWMEFEWCGVFVEGDVFFDSDYLYDV